ncbi:hypothetical protein [Exiguobacterium flavidum]|uniref:hypothetical protein n=1 Tax=Exiguobacterium flavidum TaxID=2184695 RepID=UPI000DF7DFED|nr:hypothetical protein [Exiguobacterium flavidum]
MNEIRPLRLACYQFYPQGTKEKATILETEAGIKFEFNGAEEEDKLYVQLFDQSFQYPPSKVYRKDASFNDSDRIRFIFTFEVESPLEVQLFKMQYGNTKRMRSETETVVLSGHESLPVEIERVEGAVYFKIAFKFIGTGDFAVRLTNLSCELISFAERGQDHVI